MIKLTEDQIIDKIAEYTQKCDAEQLATLAGNLFGGRCYPTPLIEKEDGKGLIVEDTYSFEPNDDYLGAFGDAIVTASELIEKLNDLCTEYGRDFNVRLPQSQGELNWDAGVSEVEVRESPNTGFKYIVIY